MKRLAGFLSAVVITAMSSAAFAQAPAAAGTNADMARDNQAQGGKATKAERQAARKKRLAGPGTAPETNTAMAQDAQGKGGKATKAERQAARKKRLAGPSSAPETNAAMARDGEKK
ncbi:MAG: hypothetical protein WBC18_09930 [Ottowia sp.]|uniref:hypothetical protein n=1 Tax=Ottowia sp. TaxID=1898956 RepID=UPI003C784786